MRRLQARLRPVRTACEWTAQVDQRRALTKEQLADVNRRIAELEHAKRVSDEKNRLLQAENDALKDTLRDNGIALPEPSSFGSAGSSPSLQSSFFPSPAGPTSSLPSTSDAEQGHSPGMLSVDYRPRSGSSSYPAGHPTQNRTRSKSDPYLHPHANPAFVGKGLTIPGVNNHNNEGGFIAHAHTQSAPVLQITTANEDENESDGFATSGYSSYGYDTPSPASSAYDLPPQSPYPTTPNSPFLSAPASPYIQNHGPTMTTSVFDVPSSPVKNAVVLNHSVFKSEVDLHPSPFLPTYAGSSNSSPSLYDQHNFTFTNNANDSMLLGMSGGLFAPEERDEMKVEI
ncbi:hypothetical protein EXIGLDRAFT_747813 [Exidia glandulosa HHB12029]|uniref:Uncharacterized protein n=1 Tax=Exidia glandulosa HHB12029 TaxID=1314781 RepID=A0A165KB69_EXIGL|nr:hypothetical protein EXIGLDRAFT_747813 [Exidia glandulosa HHB12029]